MNADLLVMAFTIGVVRVLAILSGLVSLYLGYRLFALGVMSGGGETRLEVFKSSKVYLKATAPGTFFALFGSLVIVTVVVNQSHFNTTKLTPAEPYVVQQTGGFGNPVHTGPTPPSKTETPQIADVPLVIPEPPPPKVTGSPMRGGCHGSYPPPFSVTSSGCAGCSGGGLFGGSGLFTPRKKYPPPAETPVSAVPSTEPSK